MSNHGRVNKKHKFVKTKTFYFGLYENIVFLIYSLAWLKRWVRRTGGKDSTNGTFIRNNNKKNRGNAILMIRLSQIIR